MSDATKRIAKCLMAAVAAAVLCLTAAACGSRVPLAGDASEDGTVTYTFDKCKTEEAVAGSYTLEEGNVLVVTSDLSAGTAHLTFSAPFDMDAALDSEDPEAIDPEEITSTEVILEFDATGTDEATLDLEPGDYILGVCGDDGEPATGTVTITPTPAE